jgi:hypothetical protein
MNKLHWAGRAGESMATVVPKHICEEAGWVPGMMFYSYYPAGVARTPEGNVVPGPAYETLAGDNTLHAVQEAVLCEALPRDVRVQLQALLTVLTKCQSPWSD